MEQTSQFRKLPFRSDGSFVIVQFTDLHISDGAQADRQTTALMSKVLALEKPDLAILTGDVVAGADTAVTDSASAWRMAVEPMERLGIRWAAVFGNHDDEGTASRAELMQVQLACPGCLSQPGPASLPGVGNYVIDLESTRGEVAARLYFLDSLGDGPKDVSRYAWISTEQIDWFREQANAAADLTGLVFFHIPLPEYDAVWQARTCLGNKFEQVCCPSVNSGLFAAMRESRAVSGVFVGHDHINDYEGTLHGIRLCYGRATGYGSYGRETMPRGARVIRLHQDRPGFETWLRLGNGDTIKQSMPKTPD